MLSEFHMTHASKGDLGIAMGPEFDVYEKRRAPYIPNGDFLFVDRVMSLQGERGKLVPGSVMVTEYDSPPEAWYYRDNSNPSMPNCVLMETSLQAAILLGYYLGATLAHPDMEFSIRNLDGHAVWLRDVDLRDKTIRHKQTLLSMNMMSGSVLQNFSYELSTDGEPFYRGESLFGYFTAKALANQVGLDGGKHIPPWLNALAPAERPASVRLDLKSSPQLFDSSAHPQGLSLSSGQLRLLDWVDLVPGGGKHGQGYGIGYREILPSDWYFSCHFYRDPVMPGSLGIEALIQAVQSFIIQQGLAKDFSRARFALAKGIPMRWKYRGQILKDNKDMWIDFHVKEIRREPGRLTVICDGNLWKSSMRIYEVHDLAVAVLETR
jgi:3-hydroxymyristoyl/3-hydroxydecanoyl-(acyl carrier protein) dehydratase